MTGTTTYTNSSSSVSWYLKDTVQAKVNVGGVVTTYSKTGYGHNAATASATGIQYVPYELINTGWYRDGSTYQLIKSIKLDEF